MEAPSPAASEHFEVEPLTVDEPAATGEGIDGESTTTPKKRRRGTRGGRNRKRKPAEGGATASVATAATAEEKKAPERKPRDRTGAQSRRRAPRRAPLPKAKRELLISVDAGEKRVAVLEDG